MRVKKIFHSAFRKKIKMDSNLIITPIQDWLLSEGKCVGCGRSLDRVGRERKNGHSFVTCVCRRVFVWEPERESFRRANLEDIR